MGDGDVQLLPQGNIVYPQGNNTVSNYTPAAVDQYIDHIEFGSNGEFFLATSSLNKRSWTGDVWWFSSPADAPSRDKARTGYRIDSGIVRGKYIGNNQFLLGLDSGGIQVVNTNTRKHETKGTPFHFFEMLPPLCEHDDRLSDLDTWTERGDNHLVTVGMDGRIVVWNRSLALLHNYHPAHPDGIISVTCHPTTNSMFATAGLEGEVKVWDTRDSKPCSTVYSNPDMPASAISWHPASTNTILVATKTGVVLNLDTVSREVSSHLTISDREIRTIRWSPSDPSLCAVCGDDVNVSVVHAEAGQLRLQYTNSSHSDFVRGLAWDPRCGTLWSAGWDKQVLRHSVQ